MTLGSLGKGQMRTISGIMRGSRDFAMHWHRAWSWSCRCLVSLQPSVRTIALSVLLLISTAGLAFSQTVTQSLQWDQGFTGTLTLADVQAFTYTLKIDATAATSATVTCIAGASVPRCSTPINLAAGPHTLVITATNMNGTASGTLNYVPGASPTGPVNITIVTNITVP